MLERRTVPHDLLEVHVATDLFFEIKLLLGQFLFQVGDLAVCKTILYSDGDLTGCFLRNSISSGRKASSMLRLMDRAATTRPRLTSGITH